MANKKKESAATPRPPQSMGTGAVTDIVKQIVRTAIREQSREIEAALNDIDRRLQALEK